MFHPCPKEAIPTPSLRAGGMRRDERCIFRSVRGAEALRSDRQYAWNLLRTFARPRRCQRPQLLSVARLLVLVPGLAGHARLALVLPM